MLPTCAEENTIIKRRTWQDFYSYMSMIKQNILMHLISDNRLGGFHRGVDQYEELPLCQP